MSMALILAYTATAVVYFVHSLYRMAADGRGRARWFRAADLVILGSVALLSSAAWIVFLPVLALGWLRSTEGHRRLERIRSAAGARPRGADSVTVGC